MSFLEEGKGYTDIYTLLHAHKRQQILSGRFDTPESKRTQSRLIFPTCIICFRKKRRHCITAILMQENMRGSLLQSQTKRLSFAKAWAYDYCLSYEKCLHEHTSSSSGHHGSSAHFRGALAVTYKRQGERHAWRRKFGGYPVIPIW